MTNLKEVTKYLIGIIVAGFSWYMSQTIQEIRSDIKILLESKATNAEQIRSQEHRLDNLEHRIFGSNFSLNLGPRIDYDKPKTLAYNGIRFYYS